VSAISEEGDRYKHPRKSTLMGISHSNLNSMLTNMHAVMDQWIAENLGKEVGDAVNVDIGVEMQKATINSIGKIAFGYDFSTEERDQTLHNILKISDEFGMACEKNPVRKSPIGIFIWAAKREASRCVMEIRSLARNILEAHKSKSAEEKQKIVILNELTAPGTRYEAVDGVDALISDMLLLFFAGFDTSKLTYANICDSRCCCCCCCGCCCWCCFFFF
jgi:cytochrome P450